MRRCLIQSIALVVFLFHASAGLAQNKLLTIDDIFDSGKRINFNGDQSQPRWLKDGEHYIVASKDRNAFPRLLKVDAVTGKSDPFYDAAKMQAVAVIDRLSLSEVYPASYRLAVHQHGPAITKRASFWHTPIKRGVNESEPSRHRQSPPKTPRFPDLHTRFTC